MTTKATKTIEEIRAERAAVERQAEEGLREDQAKALQNKLAEEPKLLTEVERFVPCVDASGSAICELTQDDFNDAHYVSARDYRIATEFLTTEAINGHSVANLDFAKIVDMLRHALGSLDAIAGTSVDGTVAERLKIYRDMAHKTADGIKKQLCVDEYATND